MTEIVIDSSPSRFLNSRFSRKIIELSPETVETAKKNDFDVQGYKFEAEKEDLRKPRIVRVSYHKTATINKTPTLSN